MASAARLAGRDPASVRLVAVCKTFPVEAVVEAFAAGQRDFGENRVQEALAKIAAFEAAVASPAGNPPPTTPPPAAATTSVAGADLQQNTPSPALQIRWHLLGHLQTNKARKAAPAFAMIQSIDSVDLLEKIDRAAAESGQSPELLIQVDLAGETTKFGVPPAEVPRLLDAAAALRTARVVGLMTLPPVPDTPDDARPFFRRLRDLRDGWLAAGVPAPMLRELSMGMSGDFEVAIQEGATMVRVGTAIFGNR
jgi:pyridoxal phosphate enzyme (YggS family)